MKTIAAVLKRNGLVCQKSKLKARLTDANKQDRVDYAANHFDWSYEQWSNVVFTDESLFSNGRSHSRNVWKPRGVENPAFYTNVTGNLIVY